MTTIMDFEDSVAAVDAEDKTLGYSNWLGLMKGDLAEEITKDGRTFTRVLNDDRVYTAADGSGEVRLHGRSMLFVRNVGHLMTNPAVLDAEGNEMPEGILDALITSLAAMHGIAEGNERGNSRTGSIYIEAQAARPCRGRVHHRAVRPRREAARPAGQHLKVGHHGRGAAHLGQSPCIAEATESAWCSSTPGSSTAPVTRSHSMEAGPMIRAEMKSATWMNAC